MSETSVKIVLGKKKEEEKHQIASKYSNVNSKNKK
jgi:hypothetical protein